MRRTLREYATFYNLIRAVGVLAIIVAFGWYVAFQSRLLIAGPNVVLTREPSTIQSERTVTLEGTAHNVVSITLNGRAIFVNEAGAFEELLVLEPGYTIMTIRAHDRYGRVTTLERSFIYSSSS